MDTEQTEKRRIARLKKCLTAVKILVIISVAAIVALIIFISVAYGINLAETDPVALLTGVVVTGGISALTVIGALICLAVATVTISKLKKRGSGS